MDARDYVGPTAVRAAVLPARAAYLIAAGSKAGLRSAIQEACTRWGGMTEPIIPVRPDGDLEPWWSRVVSLGHADIAVNVDADPKDAAAAARALGLDLVSLAMIDLVGVGAFTVHPSAVGPEELPGYNAYVMASEKLQLWEVTGAGNLTNDHLDSVPQGTFYTQRPMTDDQVARAQLSGSTLVERTCSQFGEHSASGGLLDLANGHGPHGIWAAIWLLQVDVFIAVGELALFIPLADAWSVRSRAAAWTVTMAGLTALGRGERRPCHPARLGWPCHRHGAAARSSCRTDGRPRCAQAIMLAIISFVA